MAEEALPAQAVTEMIAEAIQLVVHLRMDALAAGAWSRASTRSRGSRATRSPAASSSRSRAARLRWTGIRPRRELRLLAAGLRRRPGAPQDERVT